MSDWEVARGSTDGQRMLRDLRELDRLTGGRDGAQRVCWSAPWRRARALLLERLAEFEVTTSSDEAGNLWAYTGDDGKPAIVIGSHLDSVPGGGWLDGTLGVMAGLEVLRALAEESRPLPCGVALVDWADEEGVRFGRGPIGSAIVSGALDPSSLQGIKTSGGEQIEDVLGQYGVDLHQAAKARARLDGVQAYLELHVEQGPILDHENIPVAAVAGTAGMRRSVIELRGRSAHAGTTPMADRRDALMAAARAVQQIRAEAVAAGGLATVGVLNVKNAAPNKIAGAVELVLDHRHRELAKLDAMVVRAEAAVREAALAEGVESDCFESSRLDPVLFDADLVETVRRCCREACGEDEVLTSGAFHDATVLATRVPSAMIFTSSKAGLSHCPEEDTEETALLAGLEALELTARSILSRATPP